MGNDSQTRDRSRTFLLRKREPRGGGFSLCCALLLVAACGGPAVERPASAAPRAYPGTCTLIGIEEVPAVVDQGGDTIALVARYRFDGGATTDAPFGLRFQVARSRAHDLREHLTARPTVVCDADSTTALPDVELPPFEGQAGRPQ